MKALTRVIAVVCAVALLCVTFPERADASPSWPEIGFVSTTVGLIVGVAVYFSTPATDNDRWLKTFRWSGLSTAGTALACIIYKMDNENWFALINIEDDEVKLAMPTVGVSGFMLGNGFQGNGFPVKNASVSILKTVF